MVPGTGHTIAPTPLGVEHVVVNTDVVLQFSGLASRNQNPQRTGFAVQQNIITCVPASILSAKTASASLKALSIQP